MKIKKTATIQVSGCKADDLDVIGFLLGNQEGESPVISDGFVMTDCIAVDDAIRSEDHEFLSDHILSIFKGIIDMRDSNPEINNDESVMFTL